MFSEFAASLFKHAKTPVPPSAKEIAEFGPERAMHLALLRPGIELTAHAAMYHTAGGPASPEVVAYTLFRSAGLPCGRPEPACAADRTLLERVDRGAGRPVSALTEATVARLEGVFTYLITDACAAADAYHECGEGRDCPFGLPRDLVDAPEDRARRAIAEGKPIAGIVLEPPIALRLRSFMREYVRRARRWSTAAGDPLSRAAVEFLARRILDDALEIPEGLGAADRQAVEAKLAECASALEGRPSAGPLGPADIMVALAQEMAAPLVAASFAGEDEDDEGGGLVSQVLSALGIPASAAGRVAVERVFVPGPDARPTEMDLARFDAETAQTVAGYREMLRGQAHILLHHARSRPDPKLVSFLLARRLTPSAIRPANLDAAEVARIEDFERWLAEECRDEPLEGLSDELRASIAEYVVPPLVAAELAKPPCGDEGADDGEEIAFKVS